LTSGVQPSPNVTVFSSAMAGKKCRYRQIERHFPSPMDFTPPRMASKSYWTSSSPPHFGQVLRGSRTENSAPQESHFNVVA